MRKIVSLILISLLLVAFSTTVFATNPVLGNGATTITGNEYADAQNNNTTTLPQTGIEDYGVTALLAVFAVSAIFAFKKVRDYKDI